MTPDEIDRLVGELIELGHGTTAHETLDQAASLIRSQAQEIAGLKAEREEAAAGVKQARQQLAALRTVVEARDDRLEAAEALAAAQAKRIADLEAQLNQARHGLRPTLPTLRG